MFLCWLPTVAANVDCWSRRRAPPPWRAAGAFEPGRLASSFGRRRYDDAGRAAGLSLPARRRRRQDISMRAGRAEWALSFLDANIGIANMVINGWLAHALLPADAESCSPPAATSRRYCRGAAELRKPGQVPAPTGLPPGGASQWARRTGQAACLPADCRVGHRAGLIPEHLDEGHISVVIITLLVVRRRFQLHDDDMVCFITFIFCFSSCYRYFDIAWSPHMK